MSSPDGPLPLVYEPLDAAQDCTRLVRIEPAHNEAPIRCQLVPVKFSERPRYEALSYMWGDDSAKHPIFINGKSFAVAKNLFDGLHFLRRCRTDGLFWIDAICINQDDLQEKNRQIRIMPHIYFRAKTVLVWLGLKSVVRTDSLVLWSMYTCT